MSLITIPQSQNVDLFYRYKREKLTITMTKKNIYLTNFIIICNSIERNPKELSKYLSIMIGRQLKLNSKTKDIIIPNFGSKELDIDLDNIIEKYIIDYVLCKKCGIPEIYYIKSKKKYVKQTCKACGYTYKIDENNILYKHINQTY